MNYGDKRNYPKIDLYVHGKYMATTTWARTCRMAREWYAEVTGVPLYQITAYKQKGSLGWIGKQA